MVLAAGPSSRLGRPKQLVEFAGIPLVAYAATQVVEHCDAGVIVVTGARHDEVVAALAGLPIRAVYNPAWREGMGASVRQGMTGISPKARAVLLVPADLPRVDAAVLQRLVDAWREAPDRVTAARYDGVVGTPAIFPRRLWTQLQKIHGDRGARRIIESAKDVLTVDMPEAAFDLDTPEDLAALQ